MSVNGALSLCALTLAGNQFKGVSCLLPEDSRNWLSTPVDFGLDNRWIDGWILEVC